MNSSVSWLLSEALSQEWNNLTRIMLKSRSKKRTLIYSTHFGFYERIQTIFQKFSNWKTSSIVHHKFWWYCDTWKCRFFNNWIKLLFLRSKNMNFFDLKPTTTFWWVKIPSKVMAHNTWSFLIWELIKNCFNSLRKEKIGRVLFCSDLSTWCDLNVFDAYVMLLENDSHSKV